MNEGAGVGVSSHLMNERSCVQAAGKSFSWNIMADQVGCFQVYSRLGTAVFIIPMVKVQHDSEVIDYGV